VCVMCIGAGIGILNMNRNPIPAQTQDEPLPIAHAYLPQHFRWHTSNDTMILGLADNFPREDNQPLRVSIPDGTVWLGSFEYGGNQFQGLSITELYIPNSVTGIASDSFMSNNIRTVIIPYSVEFVGGHAFNLNPLEYVFLPSSVERTGNHPFVPIMPQHAVFHSSHHDEPDGLDGNFNLGLDDRFDTVIWGVSAPSQYFTVSAITRSAAEPTDALVQISRIGNDVITVLITGYNPLYTGGGHSIVGANESFSRNIQEDLDSSFFNRMTLEATFVNNGAILLTITNPCRVQLQQINIIIAV